MSSLGVRLFRNNVGLFTTDTGSKIKTGLCNGSSDLVGFDSKGKFIAIEVKTKTGKLSEDQSRFIDVVNSVGGIAYVARSTDEAITKYKESYG